MVIIRLVCLCLQVWGPQIKNDLLVHLFVLLYLRRIKAEKNRRKKSSLDASSERRCCKQLLEKCKIIFHPSASTFSSSDTMPVNSVVWKLLTGLLTGLIMHRGYHRREGLGLSLWSQRGKGGREGGEKNGTRKCIWCLLFPSPWHMPAVCLSTKSTCNPKWTFQEIKHLMWTLSLISCRWGDWQMGLFCLWSTL